MISYVAFLVFCLFTSLWLCFRFRKSVARWAVVDGSNVMYWRSEKPSLDPVRDVLSALTAQGFKVCVLFDANAGYLLEDCYLHDEAFAKRLKLPKEQVKVVPKGQPADPFILNFADHAKAIVVSRDKFRDWREEFPYLSEPGRVLSGGYEMDRLNLKPQIDV